MPRPKSGQEPRPGGKVSTSYYLDTDTLEQVRQLASRLNLRQSQVIERAVAELAERSLGENLAGRVADLETGQREIQREVGEIRQKLESLETLEEDVAAIRRSLAYDRDVRLGND